MTALNTAPVLSTPDEHVFLEPTPTGADAAFPTLSKDEVRIVYEIERTATEIIAGGWKNVALQFPDDMLKDAPSVYELLKESLVSKAVSQQNGDHSANDLTEKLANASLTNESQTGSDLVQTRKLTILADTSYGACCVDEIAAEHVDAQVVVHYGRTCLSPTARLPVIYVFTLKPLDLDAAVNAFKETYPDQASKVILLADVPYQGHVHNIADQLASVGYSNLFTPSIVHNPASLIPNRSVPDGAGGDNTVLSEFSVFHISDPPPSLLLNLSSRVSSVHIYPTTGAAGASAESVDRSTAQALRRRYALVTKLSSVPIFGILVNTLSVKNYMSVLQHVKDMITAAGKKYYTFVVGKVNAAKVANFSEVGGWVVIGCWESSLIESKDFWKPIITPFELKLALTHERDRVWTGEWNSNFQSLLDDHAAGKDLPATVDDGLESDEDEPPVYDFRTGRYVSQSRPMGRPRAVKEQSSTATAANPRPAGTDLVHLGPTSLATIGGTVSPAAEYLRSQRTWRGLGSDAEIAYQHDGAPEGAAMEEGRGGIARGYAVGDEART